ncbi:MAG: polyphosphate polymerase domain-containing protein [Verrucomicrobiota bacterium]|nr:polyphosphate polymerase domain-containing protein [Limisphaera sp.]MDW8382181.1 polyphosphate polymerase domain-containing protein [Verrucomicrobiota bacterium]
MTASVLLPRYERKFLPHGLSLADTLAMIHRHPAGFREMYPPRYVNSVYFDTMDLADYHDHVSGVPYRRKVRVRWYGDLEGHVAQPILEQKQKRGHVVWKESSGLAPLAIHGRNWYQSVCGAWDANGLNESVRFVLCHRQPVLLTRYLRRYYVSADKQFRLTVDTDLEFHTPLQPRSYRNYNPHTPRIVLELKFSLHAVEHAAMLTRHFPFRMVRCSKYVLGVSLLLLGSYWSPCDSRISS